MATTAELEQRLSEAETALHEINLGNKVVRLKDANGDEVQYGPADAPRLERYIASLKQQLGASTGRYRPIGVRF